MHLDQLCIFPTNWRSPIFQAVGIGRMAIALLYIIARNGL